MRLGRVEIAADVNSNSSWMAVDYSKYSCWRERSCCMTCPLYLFKPRYPKHDLLHGIFVHRVCVLLSRGLSGMAWSAVKTIVERLTLWRLEAFRTARCLLSHVRPKTCS
jgi:hypothetical protein